MGRGERPAACASCPRKVEVVYQEILQGNKQLFSCCSSCPFLIERLGEEKRERSPCPECHEVAEPISSGESVGCVHCYTVFEKESRDSTVGYLPDSSLPLTKQLEVFYSLLREALFKEDYEGAAWLRDQIEELQKERDKE